ncbi:MAG: rRNA maturation RNase YbeY [Chloroflexota bacterium]|nr:rRNA maturation RNase YbeY [Chloroflexota bacterium]
MNQPSNIQLQIDPQWAQQVDGERLARAAHEVLRVERVPEGAEMSLVVVGDEEMVRLNESFRDTSHTTDVLSFPYVSEGIDEEMEDYLGDVILCYDQAARQAEEEGHSVEEELILLTVHGTLHLLGYDDETPEEKAVMWAQQRRIMEQLDLGQIAPR